MKKKNDLSFIIKTNDKIPILNDIIENSENRPPPKVVSIYRDTHGQSPRKINKMIEIKKKFEIECERVQNERELAEFELKHNFQLKRKEVIPTLPIIPKIDQDLIRYFEPPSATRFYDFPVPKKPNQNINRDNNNNQKFEFSPYMIGQSSWNVLDEYSIPNRPKTQMKELYRPSKFTATRTGPRPAGIPIVLDDLAVSRKVGQMKFEKEIQKKIENEMNEREIKIKKHSETCRNALLTHQEKIRSISNLSGQAWANDKHNKPLKIKKLKSNKNINEIIEYDDKEAINELKKIDDKIYEERKKKKYSNEQLNLILNEFKL